MFHFFHERLGAAHTGLFHWIEPAVAAQTLHFPRVVTVTDAITGEVLGRGVREITFHMDAVQTRMFWLE